MALINVYCDESCHLENDGQTAMSLGAVWCERKYVPIVAERIRAIKVKHHLSPHFEVKWTKVSPAKLEFYKELIQFFFNEPTLHFRGVVIPDKAKLRHEKFGQDHNVFYYKMFFLLLKVVFEPRSQYALYFDIKDSKSQKMIKELHQYLCNSQYDFNQAVIQKVQHIRSHESEIMMLTDLFIGALSYLHRGLEGSSAKNQLIQLIRELSGYQLDQNTLLREDKFNLFIWQAVEGNHDLA